MILLNSRDIEQDLIGLLQAAQLKIDSEVSFRDKTEKAKSLWKNKNREEFDRIREHLNTISVSEGLCNYCENNEAIDIEHIWPKSFFPGKCFLWENYLLACKKCNTHHKLDRFAIFINGNVYVLPRKTEPANFDSVMIDPRSENPLDYLTLDIKEKTLLFVPSSVDTSSREYKRAQYTIDLLDLNRERLAKARLKKAKWYLNQLKKYNRIKQSTNISDIKNEFSELDMIEGENLNDIKQNSLNIIKIEITSSSHITVWEELKRQKDHLKNTKIEFSLSLEAMNW